MKRSRIIGRYRFLRWLMSAVFGWKWTKTPSVQSKHANSLKNAIPKIWTPRW